MNIDKGVMMFAGIVVLVSLVLALAYGNAWLWLTGLVGVMLVQAPVTGICPAAMLMKKLGLPPGAAFPCNDSCCCKKP
jgi:hypothetical protein